MEIVAVERTGDPPVRLATPVDRAYVVVTDGGRPSGLTVVTGAEADLGAAIAEAESFDRIAIELDPGSPAREVFFSRHAAVLRGSDFSYLIPARKGFAGADDVRATLAQRGGFTALAFEPMPGPVEPPSPPPEELHCPGPPEHKLWLPVGVRYCELHDRRV